jgi:TRAP-type C4-dicarboxylate transport system substrate-binding protein
VKGSVRAALAAATILLLPPSTNAALAQDVTLRVHTFMPPVANPYKHFLTPWAEKVGKDSKGRINVQLYPAMQLGGKAPQLLQQVRDGVVDVIWTLPGFTPGVIVKDEVFELPFIHRDTRSSVLALQDFADMHLKSELAPYHPLLLHAHAGALFMTKNAITKIEDFKGMKIRSPSRTGTWIIEALGASGLQLPLPELVPMLSKGTVDGAILTYEIAPAVKMHELVDYFTTLSGAQSRMATTVFAFLMNKQKYDSLPADLKKVIDDNSGRNLAPFAIKVWDMIDADGLKVMHSNAKNKFVALDAAETERFRKAVAPVNDRFIAEINQRSSDGAKVIADAKALIAKYAQ